MLANLDVDLTQTAEEAHKDMVTGKSASLSPYFQDSSRIQEKYESKEQVLSQKQIPVQHEPLGLAQANIETREQRIKEAIAAEKKAEKKAA
jgi:hypothetical protein